MTYSAATAELGLILPVPNTGQAFETTNVNANFTQIENGVHADRLRLSALETKLSTGGLIPVGSGASRDSFYGAPSTGAARVTLANTGARWYNTDIGMEQAYFAQLQDPGASAYNAKGVAGWYAPNNGARVALVPTSVAGTGATIRADGAIIFAASAGTINIDQVFSADFDDYEYVLDIETSSAAAVLTVQLRTGVHGSEVTNTTSNYRWTNLANLIAGTTPTPTGSGATSIGNVQIGRTSGVGGTSHTGQIAKPNSASLEKKFTSHGADSAGGAIWEGWAASAIGAATGFGLTFGSGGSVTGVNGQLKLFGIPKV